MPKDSEFRAYNFIENSLKKNNWNTKNPSRYDDGEVYTQGECLNNKIIKQYLINDKPENVVIVKSNCFWIIEAKSNFKQIDEAKKDAIEYCNKLNQKKTLAPFFSIVVGDSDNSFIVKNYFLHKSKWIEIQINKKKTTGLLNKEVLHRILNENTPDLNDVDLPDYLYFQKAIAINEILHNGGINKNLRSRVVSTILLALLKDNNINRENNCLALITELNSRAEEILFQKKKNEFISVISIPRPPTPDNYLKFRKAILDTIQELDEINIRSAMNSGTDILGRFYEQFLKYGNGAKEIGIVLTPRHITKFATNVSQINNMDYVLDPACGTGGFLVSAFDRVKKQISDNELETYKKTKLHGIEQDAEVVSLAIVNMIFRGDGKTNIYEGNCFTSQKINSKKFNKVLMNPPFALKKGDEKEFKFIDYGLSKLETNGLLFAIIPNSIMTSRSELHWRKKMLSENSLLASIKLPDDLFYPVAVCTVAILIKKGIPHNFEENVFFADLKDGYEKKKSVMIKKSEGNIESVEHKMLEFLNSKKEYNQAKEIVTCPIINDKFLECCPERYLPEDWKLFNEKNITIEIEKIIKNLLGYKINN